MKERLLFATKGDQISEDGISYVIELAKALNAGIAILMIYEKRFASVYEDVMTAAAFAEAGEFKTAKEMLMEQEKEIKEAAEKKFKELIERYGEISGDMTYQVAIGDVVTSIKDFMKNKPNVDMVILSPNLSGNKNIIDIKKLIKNITKPIVTISRPLQANA